MKDPGLKYLLAFVAFWPLQLLEAQTVTLNGPSSPLNLAEGDDFATVVLGNSWDFNERRDFGLEENYSPSTISIPNGIWTAVSENGRDTLNNDPNASGVVHPLYGGDPQRNPIEPLPGDLSLPKTGFENRIDTSRYSLLSFRMNHSARSSIHISWESDETLDNYVPEPD